jgi:hypothetical protein
MLLARPNHLDLVYVENKALPPEILNRLLRIGAFQNPSLLPRRLSEDPAKTHGKVFGAVVALVVKIPPGSGCRASRIIGEPSTLVILAESCGVSYIPLPKTNRTPHPALRHPRLNDRLTFFEFFRSAN